MLERYAIDDNEDLCNEMDDDWADAVIVDDDEVEFDELDMNEMHDVIAIVVEVIDDCDI